MGNVKHTVRLINSSPLLLYHQQKSGSEINSQ